MSVRVRFTKDFDYDIPTPPVGRTVAYKKGHELSVPDAHAEAAEKARVVERVADAPAKPAKAEKADAGR